jgi:hypothetical protein
MYIGEESTVPRWGRGRSLPGNRSFLGDKLFLSRCHIDLNTVCDVLIDGLSSSSFSVSGSKLRFPSLFHLFIEGGLLARNGIYRHFATLFTGLPAT